jgi:hypothetical protein
VTLLTDENADLRSLRRVLLDELPAKAGPDDQVMLFWAGHGISRLRNFGSLLRPCPLTGGFSAR